MLIQTAGSIDRASRLSRERAGHHLFLLVERPNVFEVYTEL